MHRKFLSSLVGCTLLFTAAFPANTALAASKYQFVKLGYNSKEQKTIGKYTFKMKDGKVLLVSSKNKTTETPMNYTAFLAGNTDALYIKSGVLYRYTYKTGKSKKLHKFPLGKKLWYGYANDYSIGGIVDNKVFVNCTDETDETDALVSKYVLLYDLKSGSVKKSTGSGSRYISESKNGYGIALSSTANDPSPYPIYLYKMTTSGMTLIKKLAAWGHGGHIVSNKVYYFEDTDTKYSLKSYDVKSRKTVTIKSIAKSKYELIFPGEITDTYSIYNSNKGIFKIIYKNGKVTKMS